MSIRTKVLVQTFVAIIVVTLFGGFTVSWVTIAQYREFVQVRMESSLRQLSMELDLLGEEIQTTLLMEIRNKDMVADAREANEHAEVAGLNVKESVVNRMIQRLHATVRNKKFDFVAYYGAQTLNAYATPNQIYLVSQNADKQLIHYIPAGPSSYIRFSKDLWKPVENLRKDLAGISPPSVPYMVLRRQDGKLMLEAGGSIISEVFDEQQQEFKEIVQGVIVFRKHISNALFRGYCKKFDVTADLFSGDGQPIVGVNSGVGNQIRDIIKGMAQEQEFRSGVYLDENPHYVLIKSYIFQQMGRPPEDLSALVRPQFKIAAYTSQTVVYQNIKHVLYIQLLGLIIGFFSAILITLLTERFISKPIRLIAREMQRISAEKKFDQRVHIHSIDEIGMLANTFNQMVAMLDERNEEIEQYIKQLSDINARLEISEKQYRSLYENAIEGIVQATPEGAIMSANPSFVKMLYYEDAWELMHTVVDLNAELFVNPEDPLYIREALRETGSIMGYETQLHRKDRSRIWVSFSARGVYTDTGHFDYYEGALVDITAKKEKERAEREKQEAESASKAKSEFLANMSHEIRTPLNAILGFTEILMGKVAAPDLKNYCTSIHFSSKVLLNLIDDILDLSKIEAGKMKIQLEFISIRTTMREIEYMFIEEFRLKDIDFIVEIDERLPPLLLLDQLRVGQILTNLIGNALKFTANGYVRVRIYSNLIQAETMKTDVVLEVEDTGIGIPYNQHDAIFESFRQQDGQKNRKYGGTGLGLAIAKSLAEMMNGEISVYSEVGKGSIFHVFLSQVEYSDRFIDPPAELPLPAAIKFNPATLLIVDDITVDRQLIKEFINHELAVIEARSGEEALEILKTHHHSQENQIALILMDLKLPGLNGMEVSNRIRSNANYAHIPIIAMTAASFKQPQANQDSPFQGRLRKPIHRHDLVSELIKYLPYTEISPAGNNSAPEPSPLDQPMTPYSDSVIARLPDIVQILENELMEKWQELHQAYFIDDVLEFAQCMIEFSREQQIESLTNYAKKLYRVTDANNIDEIDQCIEEYPEIVAQLKSLASGADAGNGNNLAEGQS